MSNLSDDTLHKILQQIQSQGLASQKALAQVSAQIQVRAREKRILELTIQQLDGIKGKAGAGAGANEGGEGDVRMYKGVGKMFMLEPREAISADHAKRDKSLGDDLISLSKKAKYLEKQVVDANNQWRDIMHATSRQQAQESGR